MLIRFGTVIFLSALLLTACQTAPPTPAPAPGDTVEAPAVAKPNFTRGSPNNAVVAKNPQVQQWLRKARTELTLKQPQRAVDLLERAVRIEPRNAEIWLAMAQAYVQLQQVNRAKQMARKALGFAAGNESVQRGAKQILDIIY